MSPYEKSIPSSRTPYETKHRAFFPFKLSIIFSGILIILIAPIYGIYTFSIETERNHLLNKSIQRIYENIDVQSQSVCLSYYQNLYEIDPSWSYRSGASFNRLILDHLLAIQMENSISNLRIFGKCFLVGNVDLTHGSNIEKTHDSVAENYDENTENYENMELFATLESKLIPYFSNVNYPMYSNSVGDVVEKITKNSPFYWKNIYNLMSGKGIVIGANDLSIHQVIRLLHVLHTLGNSLPVEIVYKELSLPSRAALSTLNFDLILVDVSPALIGENQLSLSLLGSLFSTFDEIVYIDASSVPFVNPAEILESENYLDKGALFFKDLKSFHRQFSHFYSHLYPSSAEQKLFGTKRLRQHRLETTQLNFGLFAMKKSTHFVGLLIDSTLHHWKGKVGDELFWLGQALSGDSDQLNYHVNKNHAGLIGKIEIKGNMKSITSSQKAFFDDDKKLTWVQGSLESFDESKPVPLQVNGGYVPSRNPYKEIFERTNGCGDSVWSAVAYDVSRYHKGRVRHHSRFIEYNKTQIGQMNEAINTWLELN